MYVREDTIATIESVGNKLVLAVGMYVCMYVCMYACMYVYLCGSSVGQHVLAIGISDTVQPFHRSLVSFLANDLHLLVDLEKKLSTHSTYIHTYNSHMMTDPHRNRLMYSGKYLYEASISFDSGHIQAQPYCARHPS
jgi:hypothetical protein